MFLAKILEEKQKAVKLAKEKIPLSILKETIKFRPKKISLDFKKAISNPKQTNLIAEIKKASPSHGLLVKDFDQVLLAVTYKKGGAAALSIVTEEKFFKGDLAFIKEVKNKVSLPILRKDFIFDEYQIFESKAALADCILLIAAILDTRELLKLTDIARDLGLQYIVEVHNREEVEKALKTKAEIIGINNRNLDTFEVDLGTTFKLKNLIPPDKIVISESGIKNHNDILNLKNIGINAVLVGEALLVSEDVLLKTKELIHGC